MMDQPATDHQPAFGALARFLGCFLFFLAFSADVLAQAQMESISPAADAVLDVSSLVLEGEVAGAVRLTVDGQDVELQPTVRGDGTRAADSRQERARFRVGPIDVEDGERRFLLVMEDGAGEETAWVHRVVIDRHAPLLSLDSSLPSQVGAEARGSTLRVHGSVADPHLESVQVAGQEARVVGGLFEARVQLSPGSQTFEVVARDSLGHESRLSFDVELDTSPPEIVLLADGVAFPAEAEGGATFRRPVVPSVRADGAARVELRLDGRPWVEGNAVRREGHHELEAVAWDAVGNSTSVKARFTLDTTAPRFGAVERAGQVTTERTFTLQGEVEGAVEVTVDGRPASLEGGVYRAGPFTLTAGEQTFRVVARDAAGNETTTLIPVKSDPDAPDLQVAAPPAGAVRGASPIVVSGTADDADLANVTIDNGVSTVTATLDGTAYEAQVALTEGANSLTLVATDAAGNSNTVEHGVVLDTAPPVLSITAGGSPLIDGTVFAGLVTPEVTTTDATQVVVEASLDGLAWAPGTTITDLGSHELQITATDEAGNATSAVLTFTVEGAAPTFTEVLPSPGTVLGEAEVSLSGRAQGAASLTVDGQPVDLVGDDFTAGPFTLAEGPRTFALVATSTGGQTTLFELTLTRDSTPPALAFTAPPEGDVGSESSTTVSGTVEEAHFASLTVNGSPATVQGDPSTGATFSVDLTLAEGSNRLRIQALDEAGNLASLERRVVLDTRAPEVEILDPEPGAVVAEPTVQIRGQVADANLDRVEVGGTAATLASQGAYSTFTANISLPEGQSTVEAVAYDTLGHSSTASLSLTRDASNLAVHIDSPAEGTSTPAASIDVSGTVADGATVTVNGADAVVSGGTFSLAGVELVEGDNRLVARASGAGDAQGTHVRTVRRDTSAPTLISIVPASGSESLARDTSFRLTFSEAMAEPAAAAWRLETTGGAAIAADASFEAGSLDTAVLRIVPQGLLPPATELRLVATATLTDRAGNALAASTSTFTTVADGAPPAPTLSSTPPASLCANSLAVVGSALVGSRVRASGGAGEVESRAGPGGSFELEVPLLPGRLHVLDFITVDGQGRQSASTRVEVAQDCQAPVVLSAELTGDSFDLLFDGPVEPASVALTVSDASGPLAGNLDVQESGVTWTAASALPATALRLELAASLSDMAGNALGFPWVRLFGADGATSFLSGTVIDESTGRPLLGATVTVSRSNGVATVDPQPEMTTAGEGRFLIPVGPGTHDLTITRPGYSPSFRVATTEEGEGTEVFTPRLEPLGGSHSLGAAGGRIVEESTGVGAGAAVDVPAGALSGDREVFLASLSEQALPALLPYGWSPRGAVWLDLGTAPSATVDLEIPVAAAPGTVLVLASLDLDSLQWRVVAEPTVALTAEGRRIAASLEPADFAGLGAWVAVQADVGPAAPPAAVVGEVLGSSATPVGAEVLSAGLTFEPEVVLPTQTGVATVLYDLASQQPSGLPLTLVIREELELVDGSLRREAPYRAHLVLYHDASGQAISTFRLRPSATARNEPVRLGAEDVTVLRYADEGVRGNVLGPDGGWVLGESGDRFEVPAGALSEPTAIVLQRLTVDDLPLPAPAGGTVDAVLELDLAGAILAAPGQLTFALDTPPATGSRGLLLHVVDVEGAPAYRAVAELVAAAGGWETAAIDAQDLAWPGVREGGVYIALHLDFEPAFVRGIALGADGLPVIGGVVSSSAVDWIQITGGEGQFVLPVPVGPLTLEIYDPATGNRVAVEVETTVADERLDLEPQVDVVGPSVVETTPADGSVAPAGIQPQVRFSEAIDAASAAGGIHLYRDGEAVEIDLDVQGALVTLLPRATLAPGATYSLAVTGGLGHGIQDLQGYGLEAPLSITFTVAEVVVPGDIDLDKVVLLAPDLGGTARVVGDIGAVPAGRLVWVENLTSYETTESTQANVNGSFELQVAASLTDTLLFHVLVPGGNEVIQVLGPFLSADRKGAWVGREAATFATVEGIVVVADEGTFDSFTEVRIEARPLVNPPVAWPAPGVLEPLYRFDLDFGGSEARKPLNLRVPAPADAEAEWYLLGKAWDLLGEPLWSMKDIMVLDGDELTTERSASAPPPPTQSASLAGTSPSSANQPFESRAIESQAPNGEKASSNDPRDYKVALWSAGNFSVFRSGNPLYWAVVTVDVMGVVFNSTIPGMVIEVTDALEYVSGKQDWAVPTLQGQDFELHARDARTGFELFREVFEPLEQPLQELAEPLLPDKGRPFPLTGRPALFQLVAAAPGDKELAPGIKATVTEDRDNDGNLLAEQTLTITFEEDSLVIERRPDTDAPIELQAKLFSMADATETQTTIGSEIESGEVTMDRTVDLGDVYLLQVGAVLRLDDWLEIEWNEALDEDLEGFELELLDGSEGNSVPVTAEPMGTYERIRLRPQAGWQAGETYQLRLRGTIKDATGNEWLPSTQGPECTSDCNPYSVTQKIEIRAQQVFQGFDFARVRDIERLGSLLFVAAGQQGLWVLDASDPENLVNYFGGDLHFGFPLGGQARGVAIDPHGRVVVSGGGVFGPGQVKILDPLEFPENPTSSSDLAEAWRGSTLVSNQLGGSQYAKMPPATPSHIEILSRDLEDTWVLGVDPIPEGLSMSPSEIPGLDSTTFTLSASNGVSGQPVSLRNLTRGTWERKDAAEGGSWSLSLEAQRGDRLQVLRNADSLAYVLLDATGMAAVDLNHFYGESDDADGDGVPDDPEIVQSQVLRYYTHSKLTNGSDPLCDPNGLYLGNDFTFLATDFSLLGRGTNGPWYLPTLVRPYGLVMVAIDGNNPVELTKAATRCSVAKVPQPGAGDVGSMNGMAVAEAYRTQVIYNDDAVIPTPAEAQEVEIDGQTVKVGRENRDYVFLGNSHGQIRVVDITARDDLRIVAQITLPEPPAGPMTLDKEGQRLLVAGLTKGVWVVDVSGPFPLAAINLGSQTPRDADGNGEDDRVLEQIDVKDPTTGEALNVNRKVRLWEDLGLAWISGAQSLSNPGELGLGGLVYRAPRVRFLGEGTKGLLELDQVAPFGVPTAEVPGAPEGSEYPGLIRIEMHLPGELADAAGELRVDLVSVGPGGLEIVGAGDPELLEKLPPTSYRDEEGLLLKRQSDKEWHEGYQIYLSEPIVVLADLRASHWYTMTEKEEDAEDSAGDLLCQRCDLEEEEVYPEGGVVPAKAFRELLSGYRIAIRLPETVRTELEDLYGPLLASQAEAEVASVVWDISPSITQEPFQGASYGHGQAAPGTLLHSGEFTHDITDLALPGVGFDFVFTRSYRNQTVGAGPLGPGWDFGYRARLRPLPNRNVEYFDGRGRRVAFQWLEDKKRFDPPPGVFLTLTRDAAGYRMKDRAGSLLRFDYHGRLHSIFDNFKLGDDSGTELVFEYDPASKLISVSAHGKGIALEYDDEGRLERLIDDAGRDVLYEYDSDGRLEVVKSPETALAKGGAETRLVTTYDYEGPGSGMRRALNRRDNLASIEDARSQKWLELAWRDGDGSLGHQVQSQIWGEDSLSLDIQDGAGGSGQTTITDRRGKSHLYKHNSTGQVTSYTDPSSNETTWEYGAYGSDPEQGLLTEMKLPSGRKLVYEYADQQRFADGLRVPPTRMPNLGKVAQVPGEGDPALVGGACGPGNVSQNGSGEEIAWQYSGYHYWSNQPAVTINPKGGESIRRFVGNQEGWADEIETRIPTGCGDDEWTQTSFSRIPTPGDRDDRGRVKKQKLVRSDGEEVTTSLDYGDEGDSSASKRTPQSITVSADGDTFEATIETDSVGRTTKLVEPGSLERTWLYNAVGWLLEDCVVSGANRICSSYEYTANGQVEKVKKPYGENGQSHTTTSLTYGLLGELKQLVTEVTPGGSTVTSTRSYDANLNVEVENRTGSWPITYIYDDRNLLESRTFQGTGDPVTESFTYDSEGKMATYTDARSQVWRWSYDGFGRQMQSVDPIMTAVTISYDEGGQPRSTTTCDLDGNGLTRNLTFYDAGNRLVEEKTEDPQGELSAAETCHEYDSSSNLVKTTNPVGETLDLAYDSLQRLTEMSVEGGAVFRRTFGNFDGRGNPQLETVFLPVAAGNPTSNSRTFEYDAFGRRVAVVDGQGNRTQWKFDVRGNLLEEIAPGGFVSTYEYDGLERVVRAVRPQGIEERYEYSDLVDSTSVRFLDGLGQPTTYVSDGLGRLSSVTYADGKSESYIFDGSGNPVEVSLTDGSVLTQTFDSFGRLVNRMIAPGAGVGGHSVELYGYDALGRMTTADMQGVSSAFEYDGFSRLGKETTEGKAVSFEFDAANNQTGVTFPSSHSVIQWWDALGKLDQLKADANLGPGFLVQYGWQGSTLGTKSVTLEGTGGQVDAVLSGSWKRDAARRTESSYFLGDSGALLLRERLNRDGRGLLVGQEFLDRGGRGWQRVYDDAGRLTYQSATGFDDGGMPTELRQMKTSLPTDFSYLFDTVDNLLQAEQSLTCEDVTIAMPLDASQRNRPSNIGDTNLVWDDAGRLKQKGDLQFIYDYRGRLVEVKRETAPDTSATIASYSYDAQDRRVSRIVDGQVWRTAWNGWQPVEEYLDFGGSETLMSRRVYGAGIDEIVGLSTRLTPGSQELTDYVPLYDAVGNLVVLANDEGKPIERYEYSPYGERFIWADVTPPSVEQVLFRDGEILLELSEEVLPERLKNAIGSSLKLRNLTKNLDIGLTLDRPIKSGRNARQRLLLTLEEPADPHDREPGDLLELTLPAAAFQDFFGLEPNSEPVVPTFQWQPTGTQVVLDTAAPSLLEACIVGGKLRLEFTETPNQTVAEAAILIDGATTTWTLLPDGYTLESGGAVAAGMHSLTFTSGPFDLAGKAIGNTGQLDFDAADKHVWGAALPGEAGVLPGEFTARSTTGNPFGWKGLPVDPETGLIYVRNRYFDPEMGRFLTPDPLGYSDSGNLYQFGLNDPIGNYDPLGLESIRQWMDIENDLVDRPVIGASKWFGYVAWNFFTFGFLAEHDEVFENYSGAEYIGRATLAVGKAGAKGYLFVQTAGAGGAFGQAAGLGTVATATTTGSAIAVTQLAADDLFGLAEGKSPHSLSDYFLAAGTGGALGYLGGHLVASRAAALRPSMRINLASPQAWRGGGTSSYRTPFRPLSRNQLSRIRDRVDNRTATAAEWRHLQWHKRFGARRARAVRLFWEGESARLKAGQPGSRNWTVEQAETIMAGGRPKFNGTTMQGHHRYSALRYPQLANNPRYIEPVTFSEHLYGWHGGNFRNPTAGAPNKPFLGDF